MLQVLLSLRLNCMKKLNFLDHSQANTLVKVDADDLLLFG
jgi:hypothetical protein